MDGNTGLNLFGPRIEGNDFRQEISMQELTKQTSHMSLKTSDDNTHQWIDLVKLIREEVRTLGIEGNLLFHSDTTVDETGLTEVEAHALTSYKDGLSYLSGSNGFPQNIKAAIREFKISLELGNLTAGVLLEGMKATLGEELQANYYAGQLWERGIVEGKQAAKDFLTYLEQRIFNFDNQDVPSPGYFVMNSTNVNY